jgi:hypothetical protein
MVNITIKDIVRVLDRVIMVKVKADIASAPSVDIR